MGTVVYFDDVHGNVGMIEEVMTFPYRGASRKKRGYRVSCAAAYDMNFIYHVSVFEDLEDAKNNLRSLSFEID